MPRAKPKPTSGEMELLSLLWQRRSMTLSEVHEAMDRSVGYTTVQTRLNRLVHKGLAAKEKAGRPARSQGPRPDQRARSAVPVLADSSEHPCIAFTGISHLDVPETASGSEGRLVQPHARSRAASQLW